jgi:ParB-like chromosome segregation protein Spo0J
MSKASKKVNGNDLWIPDDGALSVMAKYGVAAEVRDVKISDIDFSTVNNGRVLGGRIDQKYVDQMVDGAIHHENRFPYPVVNIRKGKKPVILSGYHRTEMAKILKLATIRAYVIECDDDRTVAELPMAFNLNHGRDVSFEERCIYASQLVDEQGLSVTDASATVQISRSSLLEYRERRNITQLVLKEGVDVARFRLTHDHIHALAKVQAGSRVNTPVTVKLARLICEFKPVGEDLPGIVQRVQDAPDQASALMALDAIRAEMAATRERTKTKTTGSLTNRQKFLRKVNGLTESLVRARTASNVGMSSAEDKAAAARAFITILKRAIELELIQPNDILEAVE